MASSVSPIVSSHRGEGTIAGSDVPQFSGACAQVLTAGAMQSNASSVPTIPEDRSAQTAEYTAETAPVPRSPS